MMNNLYFGGCGGGSFLKGVKESSDLSTILTSGQAETSSGDREKAIVSSFVTEICQNNCFLD